jgi:hypothetical protein
MIVGDANDREERKDWTVGMDRDVHEAVAAGYDSPQSCHLDGLDVLEAFPVAIHPEE